MTFDLEICRVIGVFTPIKTNVSWVILIQMNFIIFVSREFRDVFNFISELFPTMLWNFYMVHSTLYLTV